MQKLGKYSMAVAIALVLSLTLFTSGVFAQSVNQSATNQKSQAVVGTAAVVPSETIGWGGGFGFGGFGPRFVHIVHFEHIVSITRFTRITIAHFPFFDGFGGFGGFGGCGFGFDGC